MEGKGAPNTAVIDPTKWDRAAWRGVLYLVDNSFGQPPVFGLIFRNESAAVEIFTDWRKRLGVEDEAEWIRISIVEGDIPGKEYGYTVHLTINPECSIQEPNQTVEGRATIMGTSRIFRMNPDRNSKNLPVFKSAFAKTQKFTLIPVIAGLQNITPNSIKPRMDLGIGKKRIAFRNVKEVSDSDIDSVVFARPVQPN